MGASVATAGAEQPSSITTSWVPPGQSVRGDGDADNPLDVDGNGDIDTRTTASDKAIRDADTDRPTFNSYRFPDRDDRGIFSYGRAPSASQKQAITALVVRYYGAAARGDGSAACSMLEPSLKSAVVEDYGSGAGPAYLRASSCQGVMAKLFDHYRSELTGTPEVRVVRVYAGHAQAVIASRRMVASYIQLQRVGSAWALANIFGQPLP